MNKRSWMLLVYLPLFASWAIDRVTKEFAEQLHAMMWAGPVGLVLHHNHGAILGLFAQLPAVLRVVSLATGGAFLLVSFFIIQFLLPSRSKILRFGMSLLMGGIMGNVTDRILTGYVVDFFVFRFGDSMSPAFNFADAIQWVGYGMIVTSLIRDGKLFWPENNTRKTYWINPRYQLSYCFKFIAVAFAFSVIAGIYSYTYFKVTLLEMTGHQQAIEDRFLIPYIITLIVVTGSFQVIMFLVALVLSHRQAGPLYAFERFLEDLFDGKPRTLKLRAGDELRHLEQLANRLAQKEMMRVKAGEALSKVTSEEVAKVQLPPDPDADPNKESA